MKKLLLTLMCLFAVCASFAQNAEPTSTEQHLKFKGIPIDGTPSEFGSKLQNAGFSYSYKDEGTYYYNGSFAGYDNCKIIVKSAGNLVYEVVAIFPKDYSWAHLHNKYSSLKEMLTSKYGTPECKEVFENTPSYVNINDDNNKYREVGYNRCNYYSVFTSLIDGMGTIVMEIKSAHCVGIHYIDFYNEQKKKSSAINDL